ncbi:MAG: hypothetical protein OQL28_06400, partial [Sedimenticola sp.]|nr:hypothetical protein [Sedimenticola sp.]
MNITLRAFAQMQPPGALAIMLIALLSAPSAQADMASDIERILEIDQQKQELRKQKRSNEITRAEKRKREQALKEEERQINRSYGKRGNKQRQEWDKQVQAARKERNEAERLARKAAKEAREQEAARARSEQRKAETEKAEAAKQEAYQALLAEASRFSQVHLPEEVVVPMAATDVQGIEFGMPKAEAERLMKEQGYTAGSSGRINDDQSTRTLALFYHTYELPEMKGTRVKALQYKQRFKPEIRFDSKAIADQIRQKYGPPTWESNGPAGVKL